MIYCITELYTFLVRVKNKSNEKQKKRGKFSNQFIDLNFDVFLQFIIRGFSFSCDSI